MMQPYKISERFIPIVLALISIFFWSLTATIATYASAPAEIAFIIPLSHLTASILYNIIFYARAPRYYRARAMWYEFKKVFAGNHNDTITYIVLFIVYQFSLYYSVRTSNPLTVNAINYLWPLLLPFFLSYHETVRALISSPSQTVMLVASFFAVLFIYYGGRQAGDIIFDGSLLLAMLTPFCAAGYMKVGNTAKIFRSQDPWDYIAGYRIIFTIGAVFSTLFSIIAIAIFHIDIKTIDYSHVILLGGAFGFLSLSLGNVLWQIAINIASKAGSFLEIPVLAFLTPILSAIMLYFFSAFRFDIYYGHSVGTLIISAAIAVTIHKVARITSLMAALIGFFYVLLTVVSLKIFFVDTNAELAKTIQASLTDAIFTGLATLFSVLAAFLLQRGWERAKEESLLSMNASSAVMGIEHVQGVYSDIDFIKIDDYRKSFLRSLYYFLCGKNAYDAYERGLEASRELRGLSEVLNDAFDNDDSSARALHCAYKDLIKKARADLETIIIRRTDATVYSQITMLQAIGLICILFLILRFPDNLASIYITVGVSTGIIYIAFLVKEVTVMGGFSSMESVSLITSPYTNHYPETVIPNRLFPGLSKVEKNILQNMVVFAEGEDGRKDFAVGRYIDTADARNTRKLMYFILMIIIIAMLIVVSTTAGLKGGLKNSNEIKEIDKWVYAEGNSIFNRREDEGEDNRWSHRACNRAQFSSRLDETCSCLHHRPPLL